MAAAAAATSENAAAPRAAALAENKITLDTAAAYKAADGTEGAESGNVDKAGEDGRYVDTYFAFSGIPGEGRGALLDDFDKIGTISVTIAPNNVVQNAYKPYYTAAP